MGVFNVFRISGKVESDAVVASKKRVERTLSLVDQLLSPAEGEPFNIVERNAGRLLQEMQESCVEEWSMQSHSWRTLNALLLLIAPAQLARSIIVTRRIPILKDEGSEPAAEEKKAEEGEGEGEGSQECQVVTVADSSVPGEAEPEFEEKEEESSLFEEICQVIGRSSNNCEKHLQIQQISIAAIKSIAKIAAEGAALPKFTQRIGKPKGIAN